MLDKGELQSLLLSLLSDRSTHGYELIRAIKSLSEGCYAPSAGMVYPALNVMAEAGLVNATAGEGGRKSFAITASGAAQLAEDEASVSAIRERLKALPGQQVQISGPIVRALANLDLVIANLPSDATAEQVDQIVTLIDALARQIERIS